jgi:hypothetical protein
MCDNYATMTWLILLEAIQNYQVVCQLAVHRGSSSVAACEAALRVLKHPWNLHDIASYSGSGQIDSFMSNESIADYTDNQYKQAANLLNRLHAPRRLQ